MMVPEDYQVVSDEVPSDVLSEVQESAVMVAHMWLQVVTSGYKHSFVDYRHWGHEYGWFNLRG